MYQCTCCGTGVMVTSEQYEQHINSNKHKKKAFQLQAPFGGIDYAEFRPRTAVKTQDFVQAAEDFPSLAAKPNVVSEAKTMQYASIKDNFSNTNNNINNNQIINPIETNGHSTPNNNDEESQKPLSIDDVFFKDGSRISSALFAISSFLKGNKTATAALTEVAVMMYWKLDYEQIPTANLKYGFMVRIDSFDLTSGQGDNKKEAKQNASSEAIKLIHQKLKRGENHVAAVTHKPVNKQHQGLKTIIQPADAYCKLSEDKLIEIENLRLNKFVVPRRYAAFVMTIKEDQPAKDGTVVAFGAGNGVLARTESVQKHPGYHITNFDSLVLAKRSLQCFFANQLTILFGGKNGGDLSTPLYFTVGRSGKVRLKEGCRLHLFMSHAPYGDCTESIAQDWQEPLELNQKDVERDRNGRLDPIMAMTYSSTQSVKQPCHLRVLRDGPGGGWVSLVELRTKKRVLPDHLVMSPSDKLTAWVHVGLHGALLSHLMDPVYLHSVQLAHNYMHEHFSRALLCRVPLENLNHFPSMASFKDPFISRVSKLPETIPPLNGLQKANVSYNWYANPITDLPEIIDNDTGLVHQDSPFKLPGGEADFICSRLSKVCMLIRLKQIIKLAVEYYARHPHLQRTRNLQGVGDAAGYRYNLFKASAIDYRHLKQSLFQEMSDKRYGDWAPNNSSNNFDLLQYYEF